MEQRRTILWFCVMAIVLCGYAFDRYTEKQLDDLEVRVGKVFWVVAVDNQTPSFLSTPAPNAPSFRAPENESFEITELVGRQAKDPYYKVRFESGKEGYLRPEVFLEGFNLTFTTFDPRASEKKKAAEAAEEEKKRVDWIQGQPWPRAIKEAAIKRQVIPGMNTGEVRKILGNPTRVTKSKARLNAAEETWFYPDGSIAIFRNGLLNRVEAKQDKP